MEQNTSENEVVINEAESATVPGPQPVAEGTETPATEAAPVESPAEFVPEKPIYNADDLDARVKKFNEGLKALQDECELTLAAEPKIINGMVYAEPKVIDTRMINAQREMERKAGGK